MERAATACFQWLQEYHYLHHPFAIFCGKGNNGGDGLALARMLSDEAKVVVYILEFGHKGTQDFQANLARLHQTKAEIKFIQSAEQLPLLSKNEIVVDALLGSGLNRDRRDRVNERGGLARRAECPRTTTGGRYG